MVTLQKLGDSVLSSCLNTYVKEPYAFKHRRTCLITHNYLYTVKKNMVSEKKKSVLNRRDSYSFFEQT